MMVRANQFCGFSLIEQVVSMALGMLMLLAASVMLESSGRSYERIVGGVFAERDGRELITQLRADLSTAMFHPDAVFVASPACWPADQLGYLCLQPGKAQSDVGAIGDLCAVHYYLSDVKMGGSVTRCLMRGYRESAETFLALEAGCLGALFEPRAQSDEPVACGVVAFEARPKSRDASGRWVDWVRDDGRGPQAVAVRVVMARRQLVGKLKQAADWDGVGAHAELLGKPAEAGRNANLDVYASLIRFGDHENPARTMP